MEILSSLGLLVLILVAFGVMAGGRPGSFVRPLMRLVENLRTFALRGLAQIFGSVFRIGAGSIKLPKGRRDNDGGHGPGPPPPRWKE